MWKTLLKLLLILGVAVYLVFAFVLPGVSDHEQECTGLDIIVNDEQNTDFINENEVRELLVSKKQFPEGRRLSDINLAQLESILVASPYIEDALCYKTAEGRISMQVTPRIPILHVLNSAGEDFYIDDHGGTMPRGHHTINLIVMTGHISRKDAGKKYMPLGKLLQGDTFWSQQIQELHVTPEGELQITPRVGDHIIILGDTSNLTDKLHRMRTFYDEGLSKTGWNIYKAIDLRFENQVIGIR